MNRLYATLLVLLLLSGCASAPAPVAQRDATLSLLRHPEFQSAAKAAPGFVTETFKVITAYEAELARK